MMIGVFAMIPMICGTFDVQRWFFEFRLFLPVMIAVRFITKSCAMIAVHSHLSVAMKAMKWTP